MLSDAQVESYRELGYVVADFNLPESVLDDLRADQKRLISRHSEFRDICPNLLAHDLRFLEVARTPEILDMVAQLIGPDFDLQDLERFDKKGAQHEYHEQHWKEGPGIFNHQRFCGLVSNPGLKLLVLGVTLLLPIWVLTLQIGDDPLSTRRQKQRVE